MAKILTIDDCLINNKKDEEQRLILESSLNSIKEDAKIANPDNYEEKRFDEKCLDYIDKMKDVYLKLSNLGDNEEEKTNIFKTCLIEKNRFHQRCIDKIVTCSGSKIGRSEQEINFYMTPEHKAKYLELLTEKLKGHYNNIRDNNFKNKLYRNMGKPLFKKIQIQQYVKEAFNDSFKLVEGSYNSKLNDHNKKQDLKRNKENTIKRTNKNYVGTFKEVVLLSEKSLKELPGYSSKGIIKEFEINKTQMEDY